MMYSIMLTNHCNLNCRYCYEANKNNDVMSLAVADTVINWILSQDQDTIYMQFHGGEPLLAYDMMMYIGRRIRKERNIKPRITTNGLLMTDKIARSLKELDFSVYVSIDGDAKIHNSNRIDHNGNGSFDRACNAVKILKENNIDVYIRGTVTPATINHYFTSVEYLLNNVYPKVGIEPDLFSQEWEECDIETYSDQVHKTIKYVSENINANYSVSHTNRCEIHPLGVCDGGVSNFFIAQNGEIYPCLYSFLAKEDRIGSVEDGLDKEKISSLYSSYGITNPDCQDCGIANVCAGMRCKYLNKYQSGDYFMPSVQACRLLGAQISTVKRSGL